MDTKKSDVPAAYRKRLASLTTHLRKYEKPKPNGYDAYATSYITSDIPWKKILQDDPTSQAAELPPFSPKYAIAHFKVQEQERRLRGESVRKQDIIPSSQEIAQHFKEAICAEISPSDKIQHLAYLYFKAMQYSEVNKALALDERYPKPSGDAIRSTYSREHQAALAATLQEKRGSLEAPFSQENAQLVKLPQVLAGTSGETRTVATEKQREDVRRLRKAIREALGSPIILRETKATEEPWQFKVKAERKRGEQTVKNKHKSPWKKNVYPPKTREQRIAELRAKVPPLGSEYLETDNLPGIWQPQLMVETFKTAYVEGKEREQEDLMDIEENWEKIFQTNKKCLDWLKSIPDTL